MRRSHEAGLTLVETLATLSIAAILLTALGQVLTQGLRARADAGTRNALAENGRFALDRMAWAIGRTDALLLPLPDNPGTNWREHVREQTVPASTPEGDSTFATAVLAVALPDDVDLDGDGADADDDGDGARDEDAPADATHDFANGIAGIDDDGDGIADEGSGSSDDDEDGSEDEDPVNGSDDDGDGAVDEDAPADREGDGCPGSCSIDEDGDGQVDEGVASDDDEDASAGDDPIDPLVFRLSGGDLVERTPVPWNEDGVTGPDGPVDGLDFTETVLASGVTRFRVERIPATGSGPELVDLTLELANPVGEPLSLHTRVRVGGRR